MRKNLIPQTLNSPPALRSRARASGAPLATFHASPLAKCCNHEKPLINRDPNLKTKLDKTNAGKLAVNSLEEYLLTW
jgi:hypothetical protein